MNPHMDGSLATRCRGLIRRKLRAPVQCSRAASPGNIYCAQHYPPTEEPVLTIFKVTYQDPPLTHTFPLTATSRRRVAEVIKTHYPEAKRIIIVAVGAA